MRILITGVTGFVGGHLAEALLAGDSDEIHGLDRSGRWPAPLGHLTERVPLHAADLTDQPRVESVLRDVSPDWIFHLAGYASAGKSFSEPEAAWTGNVTASESLYRAVAALNRPARILAASSGLIYAAPVPSDRPLDESSPLGPQNPYAESKKAAEEVALRFVREAGLEIIVVRPFNQLGPRQSPLFAIGSFARQLARVELGLAPPVIETGNLAARRDFTDVRDMVEAFRLLMERGRRGEIYNAGSGIATSIGAVLDLLRAECPIPVDVMTQVDRLRPSDATVLVADSGKLRRETGWQPRIGLPQTLHDTYAAARIHAGEEP